MRGARDVINLVGAIDMCRGWGIVLEHSVGVKKVVLMKKDCPLACCVIFFVCINKEDNFLILGQERFNVRT